MLTVLSPSLQQKFQPTNTQPYEAVLDLSRRRDSVETRKTPSPYHSSSFGDGSPTTLHESPTTSTATSISNALNRSETPVNHFPLPAVPLHQYSGASLSQNNTRCSPPAYPSSIYLFQPKRENMSPHQTFGGTLGSLKNNQVDIVHDALHHPRSSDSSHQDDDVIRPYSIQSVEVQKHIAQVHMNTSDESSEACSVNMIPQNKQYPMVVGRDGKLSRPFKAYPRDPLSITASFTASDTLMDNQSAEKYHSFRKRMLEQIHAANGGQPTISNPKMRRTTSKMLDSANTAATSPFGMSDCSKLRLDEEFRNDTLNNNNNSDSGSGSIKDSAYFERRKKNNAAAKKSRDRRRIKEDEIAIRAAFLERENIELKFELASARKQLAMYGVTTSS